MVIDIAVIASLPHLHDVAACGSIDMALTHLALRHPGYAAHHAARAAAGGTVILDNSAYELEDHPRLRLGRRPRPDRRQPDRRGRSGVCTDVPYDGTEPTITATRRFLTQAAETADGLRFMAVPQGSTRAEWLACYDALTTMPGVHSIGISKLSVPRCWDAGTARARSGLRSRTPPARHAAKAAAPARRRRLPARRAAHPPRTRPPRRAQQRFLRRVLVRQARHPAEPGHHRHDPASTAQTRPRNHPAHARPASRRPRQHHHDPRRGRAVSRPRRRRHA